MTTWGHDQIVILQYTSLWYLDIWLYSKTTLIITLTSIISIYYHWLSTYCTLIISYCIISSHCQLDLPTFLGSELRLIQARWLLTFRPPSQLHPAPAVRARALRPFLIGSVAGAAIETVETKDPSITPTTSSHKMVKFQQNESREHLYVFLGEQQGSKMNAFKSSSASRSRTHVWINLECWLPVEEHERCQTTIWHQKAIMPTVKSKWA